MKKVLVFGVFDGLHPGHDYFLTTARALGERLVVVVARDAMVEFLKKKKPYFNEVQRHAELLRHVSVSETVLGDEEVGAYAVLREQAPDLVCLGYDQTSLGLDLQRRMNRHEIPHFDICFLGSHKPERYKSSLLRPQQ